MINYFSKKLFFLIIILFVFSPFYLFAREMTLSVLYFKISEEDDKTIAPFSKAFAEMLISDFSQVKGIKLIEREDLEKVVKELELSLSGLVEPDKTKETGLLLSADYLLMGSFHFMEEEVLVNARLVEVEKGRIICASSAQSSRKEVLALKNALLDQLFQLMKVKFKYLVFPAIKSIKNEMSESDIDRYGEGLDLMDQGEYKRAEGRLKGISAEFPDFSYALDDLKKLDKRIKGYEDKRSQQLESLEKEQLTYQNYIRISSAYLSSLKYSQLLEFCLKHRNKLPSAPQGSFMSVEEMNDYYICLSYYSLKKWPQLFPEAEIFLQKYPASLYFSAVKQYLKQSSKQEIKSKEYQENKSEIDYSGFSADQLFKKANDLFGKGLYQEALLIYLKITEEDCKKTYFKYDMILYFIFQCHYQLGEYSKAVKIAGKLKEKYPESNYIQAIESLLEYMPQ